MGDGDVSVSRHKVHERNTNTLRFRAESSRFDSLRFALIAIRGAILIVMSRGIRAGSEARFGSVRFGSARLGSARCSIDLQNCLFDVM